MVDNRPRNWMTLKAHLEHVLRYAKGVSADCHKEYMCRALIVVPVDKTNGSGLADKTDRAGLANKTDRSRQMNNQTGGQTNETIVRQ